MCSKGSIRAYKEVHIIHHLNGSIEIRIVGKCTHCNSGPLPELNGNDNSLLNLNEIVSFVRQEKSLNTWSEVKSRVGRESLREFSLDLPTTEVFGYVKSKKLAQNALKSTNLISFCFIFYAH